MADNLKAKGYGPNSPPARDLRHGKSAGPDVDYAVAASNRRLEARGLDRFEAQETDGQYLSRAQIEAICKAAWALGAQVATIDQMRSSGVVPKGVQSMVRFPGRRTPAQLGVAAGRQDAIAAAAARDVASGHKPKLITAAQLGLSFQYVWGGKGDVYRGAGHYTAGHRASGPEALKAEMLSDHRYHMGKGWGGLSYEVMVADDGTLGLGNPMNRMSAAVAVNNSGMVNICCPGTTGDRMTSEQKATISWLLDNWHTTAIPSAHRLPKRADGLKWLAHREWPSQSTACAGDMIPDYKELWKRA